jgi:hypothetical protein
MSAMYLISACFLVGSSLLLARSQLRAKLLPLLRTARK